MLAVLAVLMALCSIGTAALQAGGAVAIVIALMVAFGASGTGWNGVYLAEVARLAPPGQASAATGGSLAITFLGVVLGPMLFGALSGLFDSYRAGYLALTLPTAFCAWQLLRVHAALAQVAVDALPVTHRARRQSSVSEASKSSSTFAPFGSWQNSCQVRAPACRRSSYFVPLRRNAPSPRASWA